jgi:calcium-dependent protein kinase
MIGWVIERKDFVVTYKAFTIKYMEKFKDFVGSSGDL